MAMQLPIMAYPLIVPNSEMWITLYARSVHLQYLTCQLNYVGKKSVIVTRFSTLSQQYVEPKDSYHIMSANANINA